MRRSTRLKASETLEKLKNEEFIKLASDEIEPEDEYRKIEDDSDIIITSNSPKKMSNRGRPRKSAPKIDDTFNENEEEATYSNSESETTDNFIDSSSQSPKRQAKKKVKRAGGYVPALETNPKNFMGKVISSQVEWVNFLRDQSSQIKRKNRRYKTIMINLEREAKVDQADPLISSFTVSEFRKSRRTALKLIHDNATIELNDESFSLSNDGRISLYNTGVSISSICFCKCSVCAGNSSNIIIFAASDELISIISAEISNQLGIGRIKTIARILPPNSERINSICSYESFISISTNKNIFFLNCDSIHQQQNISLCESKLHLSVSDISCHAWKGNYIAVGTLSGRLFVFNPVTMNEVLQLSIVPNSAIYSLDWSDEHTILIGGSFSKIFSVDLRDPFIVETEVSTLATLPKVVWSQALKSILFADGENHARRLEKLSNNRLHQPLGTFSSMVHELAASPLHNITATASSSGSIHLSWMLGESGYGVEFEKKIFTLQNFLEEEASPSSFKISSVAEYVQFQVLDTIKLYSSDQACTSLSWCPHERFPGLLCGGYRNGLLVLMTTDQYFI